MTIVFESIAELNVGQIVGAFAPAQGLLTNVSPLNSILGHFKPFVALHDGSQPGQVDGKFAKTRGLLSDFVTSGVIGAFEPTTGYGTEADVTPDVSLLVGGFRPMLGAITGEFLLEGTIAGKFAPARGLLTNLTLPVVRGYCAPTTGLLLSEVVYAGGVSLMIGPLYVFGEALAAYPRIVERLGLTSRAQGHPTFTIIEQLGLSDQTLSLIRALTIVRESLNITDRLVAIYKMIVQEQIAFEGTADPTAIAVQQVIEAITLLGGVGASVTAKNIVTEALALNDALAFLAKEHVTEQLAFESAYATALAAREKFVEEIALIGTATPTGRIGVIIEEKLAFQASVAGLLDAFETVTEGIQFYATLQLGDDAFQAWVCNTESEAFSQYEGFGFNSFMQFGGKYYGMKSDGVYLLEGPDDDGDKINARIRLGLNDLGSRKEKRLPEMYMLVRNDGPLLVKVITTEPDGSLREDWYQLNPRGDGTGGVREARVKIGRGLRSVYFDFEITNVNGADFEIDNMEIHPMLLDRRIRGKDA